MGVKPCSNCPLQKNKKCKVHPRGCMITSPPSWEPLLSATTAATNKKKKKGPNFTDADAEENRVHEGLPDTPGLGLGSGWASPLPSRTPLTSLAVTGSCTVASRADQLPRGPAAACTARRVPGGSCSSRGHWGQNRGCLLQPTVPSVASPGPDPIAQTPSSGSGAQASNPRPSDHPRRPGRLQSPQRPPSSPRGCMDEPRPSTPGQARSRGLASPRLAVQGLTLHRSARTAAPRFSPLQPAPGSTAVGGREIAVRGPKTFNQLQPGPRPCGSSRRPARFKFPGDAAFPLAGSSARRALIGGFEKHVGRGREVAASVSREEGEAPARGCGRHCAPEFSPHPMERLQIPACLARSRGLPGSSHPPTHPPITPWPEASLVSGSLCRRCPPAR